MVNFIPPHQIFSGVGVAPILWGCQGLCKGVPAALASHRASCPVKRHRRGFPSVTWGPGCVLGSRIFSLLRVHLQGWRKLFSKDTQDKWRLSPVPKDAVILAWPWHAGLRKQTSPAGGAAAPRRALPPWPLAPCLLPAAPSPSLELAACREPALSLMPAGRAGSLRGSPSPNWSVIRLVFMSFASPLQRKAQPRQPHTLLSCISPPSFRGLWLSRKPVISLHPTSQSRGCKSGS